MKCPKCGYLGFETTDRCRNCGYDFSLSTDTSPASELPLQPAVNDEALADLTLVRTAPPSPRSTPAAPAVDLDRVIGGSDVPASQGSEVPQFQGSEPRNSGSPEPRNPGTPEPRSPGTPKPRDAEAPIAAPRPAGPPLAVRRSTPEVPRGRSRTPRTVRKPEGDLPLQFDRAPAAADARPADTAPAIATVRPAGRFARIFAAVVDAFLLGSINVAVIYFTLKVAQLNLLDVFIIPPIPMAAFLLLLNTAYFVAFTAAGGQTIGKMLVGIRVIEDDGGRVSIGSAIIRTFGTLLSVVTLGLGYLPALVGQRRALHDRLAATRVIRN